MRFLPNIRNLTVTDTETGNVTHYRDAIEMGTACRNLNLAAKAPAKPSNKMAKREEKRQAGVR